jgi:hypothetical protein
MLWVGVKVMVGLGVVGVLGMVSPYFFALMPHSESEVCLCGMVKSD